MLIHSPAHLKGAVQIFKVKNSLSWSKISIKNGKKILKSTFKLTLSYGALGPEVNLLLKIISPPPALQQF